RGPASPAAALVAPGIGLYGLAAVTAPLLAPRFADRIPPEWSVAWGSALVAAAGPQCDAAAGREALENLTGRLQAAAGLTAPLTLTVVDDPLAEGRALPGGHILLTRGLLDLLRTPDELAGVLALEVAAGVRVGPERAILANLRLPELVTLWLSGPRMAPADLSAALVRARLPADEQAALDARALALLTGAGLRTRGLAAFHDVLTSRAAQDGREPLYARTHAADRERLERLRSGPAGGAAALGYGQWQAVKTVCAGSPGGGEAGISG
ncbi:M48 family metalloprotease, partial [Caenispirillum bisanense]|uniref:M48 family metalloprotease n=1 Tax=Caenispirillum bisanense TaxID=414052 RepID=UPI0031DE70DC